MTADRQRGRRAFLPPQTRSALGWLETQAEFRTLTARADRLLALQSDLRRCAPAAALTALRIDGDILLAGTQGAAAAARLRQVEPTIVAHLSGAGWNIQRIRFRPMPTGSVAPPPPLTPRAPIPDDALAGFDALHEASEQPRLRQALRQLIDARQRRSG